MHLVSADDAELDTLRPRSTLGARRTAIISRSSANAARSRSPWPPRDYLHVARRLHDDPALKFEQLIDLCGVDYSGYKDMPWDGPRYCVVIHLLSLTHNWRVRLKVFCARRRHAGGGLGDASLASANWFEREAFDMYGIIFDGHSTCAASSPTTASSATRCARTSRPPAMSRCATTPSSKRVIYQPVTIEPREITPRVVREDNYGGLH